ncbi:MAG: aminoglycoside phosphotransferase family protein [Pelagimonas sp.]|nr:aminoglycoside phosphotransferase family protein [Pelagimonas sp.]
MPDLSFTPLPRGYRNRVLLGQNQKHRVVFKTTCRSEDQLQWLDHLTDALGHSQIIAPIPTTTLTGLKTHRGWTAEPYITGREICDTDRPQIIETIRIFHSASHAIAQRPGFAAIGNFTPETISGDIDLNTIPADLVHLCLATWKNLPGQPGCVIHGDLHSGNMRIADTGQLTLYDWDEAHRNTPDFDLCTRGGSSDIVEHAALAYEVAVCWHVEPERARTLAEDLRNAFKG